MHKDYFSVATLLCFIILKAMANMQDWLVNRIWVEFVLLCHTESIGTLQIHKFSAKVSISLKSTVTKKVAWLSDKLLSWW